MTNDDLERGIVARQNFPKELGHIWPGLQGAPEEIYSAEGAALVAATEAQP